MQRAPEKKLVLPVVIGVGHDPAVQVEEIKRVRGILLEAQEKGAKSVGLELPSNYEKLKGECGIVDYFHFVADIAKGIGMKVVPLESPATYDEAKAVEVAKHYTKEGKIDLEAFESAITDLKSEIRWCEAKMGNWSPYDAPEMRENVPKQVANHRRWLGYYEQAGEIFKNAGFAAEEVTKAWQEMQDRRDAEMLAEIGRQKPDAVVTGAAHARTIAKKTGSGSYFELGGFENEE